MKPGVHYTLMRQITEIIGDQATDFQAFTTEFEQGKTDSSHYNRAVRRLCTSSDPKVILLLAAICPHTLSLRISVTETNRDGLSAVAYAQKNNPAAHKILLESIAKDGKTIEGVAASALPGLYDDVRNRLPGGALPPRPRRDYTTATPDTLRQDQTAALADVFSALGPALGNVLPGLMAQAQTAQTPAEAQRQRLDGAQQILRLLQPQITRAQETFPRFQPPTRHTDEPFEEAFKRLSNGDEKLLPLLEFYRDGRHEAALRWACKCKHSAILTIMDLYLNECKSRGTPIDINAMRDPAGRTPLHDAGIAGNQVYYLFVGHGAISDLTDAGGVTAADYRRTAQTSQIRAGVNPLENLLSSVLGGASATPAAAAPSGDTADDINPPRALM